MQNTCETCNGDKAVLSTNLHFNILFKSAYEKNIQSKLRKLL